MPDHYTKAFLSDLHLRRLQRQAQDLGVPVEELAAWYIVAGIDENRLQIVSESKRQSDTDRKPLAEFFERVESDIGRTMEPETKAVEGQPACLLCSEVHVPDQNGLSVCPQQSTMNLLQYDPSDVAAILREERDSG